MAGACWHTDTQGAGYILIRRQQEVDGHKAESWPYFLQQGQSNALIRVSVAVKRQDEACPGYEWLLYWRTVVISLPAGISDNSVFNLYISVLKVFLFIIIY